MNYHKRYDSLIIRIRRGVALVRLDDPAGLNAVGGEVQAELEDFMERANQDKRIKVTVITGEGRIFSVGGGQKQGANICGRIREMGKPVIAAVNGYAMGAGLDLAMGCDMVIAAEDATFYEVMQDESEGAERRLTVRHVSMGEAAEAGLVNQVTPGGELLKEALRLAASVARGDTLSLNYIRRMLEKAMGGATTAAPTLQSQWMGLSG